MDIAALIPILIGAVILFFAVRVLGRTLKLALQVVIVVIIALVFMTYLVYKDVNDLKNGFKDNNNTFFLYEEDSLYAGVILKPLGQLIITLDAFDFYTPEQMEMLREYFADNDYKKMLNNSKRLFFFTPTAINKSFKVDIGVELDEADMLEVLKSNQPFREVANKIAKQGSSSESSSAAVIIEGLKEVYGDEEKLKGEIFAAMIGNYFQKQKPRELIRHIRSKELMVYPESISFKLIRYIPWLR